MKLKSESEVAQSCPNLHNPLDCSPPGSSVHGIFKARVLEWGAIASSVARNYRPTKLSTEWLCEEQRAGSEGYLGRERFNSFCACLNILVLPTNVTKSNWRIPQFPAFRRYCINIFINWRFVAIPPQANLLVPFFHQHLLTPGLCHILIMLTVFQFFSLTLYLLWWCVISDLWCYYCNCFPAPQTVLV